MRGIPNHRRLIQRNVHASDETRAHTVTWDAWDGDIRKWMEALSPGDKIGLYPKAMYPGWENTVVKAEMDLYCAWV